jgi:AcrR family transcriptional regulator
MARALRADARRNQEQLMAAARDVFAERGADAPLEEIARRAGVGIGTLYRRFPDRQALMRTVVLDALAQSGAAAERARDEAPDAFGAIVAYMHAALDIRIAAVIPALMGRVDLNDPELRAARERATAPAEAIVDAAHAEGSLRPDVTFGDIGLIIVRLAHPLPAPISRELDERMAHRHLDLLLAGMRRDGDTEAERGLTLDELRTIGGY